MEAFSRPIHACARFLPPCCPEHAKVVLEAELPSVEACVSHVACWLMRARNGPREASVRKSTRRLDFASWMVAWDRLALATAAVGMTDFTLAMQHKAVVVEARPSGHILSGPSPLCSALGAGGGRRADGRENNTPRRALR